MKAKLAILLLTFGLLPFIANAQALQKLWHSLTDKKGNWGKNQIPGQNTTAPMVLA
ncbi:MAG: hypothetical protein K9I36_11095 [Bacteroidia bacterium]|nr:hypothetical protein [Bacteroidia bacterium]MCF8427269.1 hypothetical protein [Bacteroidia bacterium]